MHNRFKVMLFFMATLLASCSGSSSQTGDQLQGRLLLWHPFEGRAAEVLNEILDQYTNLHPQVTVIREFVPTDKMSERVIAQVESGLGPDLLINSYLITPALIEAGVLRNLNDYNIDTSIFLPASISQVRYQDKLYGLPLSLETRVLCYNKEKVTQPPATFQGLIEETRAGRRAALFSTFGASFWGVPALGGLLLDEQGRVVLDQGGLAEWFEALKQAKNEPNFIFSQNEAAIHNTFAAGNLAYYVCWSSEIPALQTVLGRDKVGVALLPTPTNEPSAPFILTNAIMFNRASAPANTELALQVAKFLTNDQQQTKLALSTEAQIPANIQVKIDNRLSPAVAALVAQSKTAIPIPLDHLEQAVAAAVVYGDAYYTRVLEGELEAGEAATELTRIVNRQFGFE